MKNNYLIQPKTVSTHPGDSAYWNEFDWQKACAAGMNEVGLPYSGEFGFTNTNMYWPVNHMVAPAKKAVTCSECHSRTDSRLANLTDFYMPGRDRNIWIDRAGAGILILTLLGVMVHGAARFVISRRRKGAEL